jgi:hypothetical protein
MGENQVLGEIQRAKDQGLKFGGFASAHVDGDTGMLLQG